MLYYLLSWALNSFSKSSLACLLHSLDNIIFLLKRCLRHCLPDNVVPARHAHLLPRGHNRPILRLRGRGRLESCAASQRHRHLLAPYRLNNFDLLQCPDRLLDYLLYLFVHSETALGHVWLLLERREMLQERSWGHLFARQWSAVEAVLWKVRPGDDWGNRSVGRNQLVG